MEINEERPQSDKTGKILTLYSHLCGEFVYFLIEIYAISLKIIIILLEKCHFARI